MKGKGNDGTGNNPERDFWKTNQKFWEKLNSQYKFNFDCCASKEDTKTPAYSPDFESVDHVGGVAWMNPPFSKAKPMFKHFFRVVSRGVAIYRCDNVETRIWQDIIFPNIDWVYFMRGRLIYTPLNIAIRGGSTRFPSALIGVGVEPPTNIEGICLRRNAE